MGYTTKQIGKANVEKTSREGRLNASQTEFER